MAILLSFRAVDVELDADAFGAGFAALFTGLDTTALHADIGEHILNATDERFEAERAPDGTPWAPLSPATLASQYKARGTGRKLTKRVKGGGQAPTAGFARFVQRKKILQDMGVRGGLRGDVSYRAEDGRVRIGVSKVYGRIHQLGAGARSSTSSGRRMPAIPARPFLGVSDDDLGIIAGIVARWAREQMS